MSKAETKRRIAEMDNEIRDLEFELAVKKRVRDELRAFVGMGSASLPLKAKPSRRPKQSVVPGSLIAHAEAAIRDAGRALTISEITERLSAKGVETNWRRGLGPAITSALARRKDLFRREGRGKYGLIGMPTETESRAP